MPGRVPDRWEEYEPLGKVVEGTRFISFKVPLEQNICNKLSSADLTFRPKDLLAQIEEEGLELGYIVDLTNTHRYYRPDREFEPHGVTHIKIKTEGHMVPSIGVQRSFASTVNRFLSKNSDNGKLIGVHCTHGINRTGYLICRYMVDYLKIPAEEAIKAFNEARGYSIERENYLEDLKTVKDKLVDDDTEEVIDSNFPELSTLESGKLDEIGESDLKEDSSHPREPRQHHQRNGYHRDRDNRDHRRHSPYSDRGQRDSSRSHRDRSPRPHSDQRYDQRSSYQGNGYNSGYHGNSNQGSGYGGYGNQGNVYDRYYDQGNGYGGNNYQRNGYGGNSYQGNSYSGNQRQGQNWDQGQSSDDYGSFGHQHNRGGSKQRERSIDSIPQ